ncbi:MAG: hypothetical protein CM1200mP18_22620 [Gammaproteobacteria bacterium]|nr:MAG: hypothetical protein CM1200mP18_22620 [Gammaproteobacteria bacterium]
MYIHALEMSPHPNGLKAADQLFELCPDVGHLQHMPAHIYVICGQYEDAIRVSRKAITADDLMSMSQGGTTFIRLLDATTYI